MTKKQYTGMNTAVALGIFVATNKEALVERTLEQIRIIVSKGLGPEIHFSDSYLKAALKEANISYLRATTGQVRSRGTSNSSRVLAQCILELCEAIEREVGMDLGKLTNTRACHALTLFKQGNTARAVKLMRDGDDEASAATK